MYQSPTAILFTSFQCVCQTSLSLVWACFLLFYLFILYFYFFTLKQMGKNNLSLSPGFICSFLTDFIACTNLFGNAHDPTPPATKEN